MLGKILSNFSIENLKESFNKKSFDNVSFGNRQMIDMASKLV
jgi:hypothetical protein